MPGEKNKAADPLADRDSYALRSAVGQSEIRLPDLPYQPLQPKTYQPAIGLIGCGGITGEHLTAYCNAGYRVVAFADLDLERAKLRRDKFYPKADVYREPADLLRRDDVDVVDLATHPAPRARLIADALEADKHVLSQKPFVLDLDQGQRLCDLADQRGLYLAVNQNGRWAPYVAWMRLAIQRGLIGSVTSVDTLIAWDHRWIAGTPFEHIPHVLLYDFAVHWFDMLHCYTRGTKPVSVTAQLKQLPGETRLPELTGQVMIELEEAQAALAFRGTACAGRLNSTLIVGTEGTLNSAGPDLENQVVTLSTPAGQASPQLSGSWFPDGFQGAMSELAVAIEENRQPSNNGRDNLASLAMCFAAMASVDSGKSVPVGSVRKVRNAWVTRS